MPQNVTAVETTVRPDVCVVIVEWDPPSNIAECEIQGYVIEHPSGKSITQSNRVTISLLLEHCETGINISIHAVDQCGRNGSRANNILTELLNATNINYITYGSETKPATGLTTGPISEPLG